MFGKYVKASVLALLGHTLSGVAVGVQTVAQYIEHALLKVCDDINGNVEIKPKPDELN